MKFTHLHTHSHYSLLDGLAKIDELIDYAKEMGMDSLALTDHGNMYGAIEFYKKAKAKGIKPIIGCEMYQSERKMTDKEPGIDDKRYHIVLLVKNITGYKNLVKIITKAHLEGFYYKPRVDEETLRKHSEGLIALSACLAGKIPHLILAGKTEEAEKVALNYQDIFGKENFFLDFQVHPNSKDQRKSNEGLINIAKKLQIPLVATNDIHYLKKEDAQAQDILMLINTGADANDPERLSMMSDDFSMKSPKEMIETFREFPEAIENTQKIADACNLELELGKTKLPLFETPNGQTPEEYLKELCYKGIEKRFGKAPSKEVGERLEYELSVINQTGFASYFLIVQDFVNWAKSNRIVVGPGRGSAGGSLVAYLVNITNIDPLKYNLLFERFLNPARISMPDIDLDFTDRRRDEVIRYVSEKYGKNRVAQIITFGTMAAKAAIRDVGRALGYVYSYCDQVAKMIPLGMSLSETMDIVPEFRELYQSDEKARTLIDYAKKLEGVARHASTHACGVVISSDPLDEMVPLQYPSQGEETIVTQYEMHSIEDLGLLKMDFLGLKNLTIIEDTLARIYKVHGVNVDLDNLPDGDKDAYKALQKGDTVGIFQLECLSGETRISNTTIKKLYEKKGKERLASLYLDEGKIHLNNVLDVVESGEKETYSLIVENGRYIKSTKGHFFLTRDGWKKLEEIKPGKDEVLIRDKSKYLIYRICEKCGKQIYGERRKNTKFCHRCAALVLRNPSKEKSRESISKARLRFYNSGGKPWNLGLNIQNSPIMAETGKKISKALTGRTLEGYYGPEKAKEMKMVLSERSRGENNPMFGKPCPHRKGGYREDLGHYVRSTWEADFARVLNLHNLKYIYEAKTFELKRENGERMHYTPDFYVPSQDAYYEIKGFLRDLDQEKLKLFQNQYPKINFTIINTTRFAEFALRYKTLVKWECPRIPKKGFSFIKVKDIKLAKREMTYDVKMKSPGNNFQANGFIVHNSGGMQRYLKQLKPNTFEDIIAMVALYRPGPMQLIPDYIARKNKLQPVTYLHPKLKPILENTQGIAVYQEQIMKIAQEMAGFSLAEADILRKAIGKKIKELLMAQKEKFIAGVKANNIDERVGRQIWDWIEPFASYSFNRSHAAAYATIAYQTAYLKAHYPPEFMSALLTSERNDLDRISTLIQECQKMKLEVLPPDVNESFTFFSVVPKKNQIRFGLSAVKNVGTGIVETIVGERKANGHYKSIEDFVTRVNTKDLNKKSLESLIKAGAFDNMEERNKLLKNMEMLLEYSRDSQKSKNSNQGGLFDGMNIKSSIRLEKAEAAPEKDRLAWEKELLGLFVSSHPLKNYKGFLEKKAVPISSLSPSGSKKIRIGGIISKIKKIITKTGKPMLFVNLEDLTDKIEVVVFPRVIERKPNAFQENKIVLVSGRVDMKDGMLKLICEDVEEIIEA